MSENIAEQAQAVFLASGAVPVDPAYVLTSDIPLELSGEAVRARLCVFSDHRGNEMVMRPDLTLPIAGMEADRRVAGGHDAAAYTYAAPAFRLPAVAGDPIEFTQVGFEWFGRPSGPQADAEAFALSMQAVTAAGVTPTSVETGDLAIFPAFVDALELPRVTTDLLKRAFRQDGGVRELLDAQPAPIADDLLPVLSASGPGAAEAALQDALAARGIPMIGTRSEAEIIAGLRAKAAAQAGGGVPVAAKRVLKDLAEVNCAAESAADALQAVVRDHALTGLDATIARAAQRMDAIVSSSRANNIDVCFRSGFGRRFTYYDGFVFEIMGADLSERQPMASGGRYDGLIEGLSRARASATGIGAMIRPDRIAVAKGVAR